jgi:hypothetical protein
MFESFENKITFCCGSSNERLFFLKTYFNERLKKDYTIYIIDENMSLNNIGNFSDNIKYLILKNNIPSTDKYNKLFNCENKKIKIINNNYIYPFFSGANECIYDLTNQCYLYTNSHKNSIKNKRVFLPCFNIFEENIIIDIWKEIGFHILNDFKFDYEFILHLDKYLNKNVEIFKDFKSLIRNFYWHMMIKGFIERHKLNNSFIDVEYDENFESRLKKETQRHDLINAKNGIYKTSGF